MKQKNKSQQIYIDLKRRIYNEEFDHYRILPTEKELENYYSTSRNTVRKAIRLLNSEGLIYSKVGSGNIVLTRIEIDNLLINSGNIIRPSEITNNNIITQVLTFEKIVIDDFLSKKTNFAIGLICFHILRLRYIDNQPTMLDDSYFRETDMPNFTKEDAGNSIYTYLLNGGKKIIGSKLVDRIVPVSENDILYLDLSKNSLVGLTQNWSYLDDGEIFEYTEIHFSPETYVRSRFISQEIY